jgi:hypothetical protein
VFFFPPDCPNYCVAMKDNMLLSLHLPFPSGRIL